MAVSVQVTEKRRVRLRLAVRVLAALVAVGLVAAAFQLSSAIRYATHEALGKMGFSASGGTVSIGLNRAEVTDIALSGRDRIAVAATYSLRGLLKARFDTLEILDIALHGTIGKDGSFALDSYRPKPAKPNEPAQPISIPAASMNIGRAAVEIDTPMGKVALTGKGRAVAVGDGLAFTGDGTANWGKVSANAPIKFNITPKGWVLDLDPIRSGDIKGTIALHAAAKGSDFKATGSGNVRFRDFGIANETFSIEGLNGTIALARFSPFATAGVQHLTAKRAIFGQALENIVADFALANGRNLTIADAHGQFMGGTVGLHDQAVDLRAEQHRVTIEAKAIDLSQLLILANLKGLSGTGKLDGIFPIDHNKDIFRIENAELRATEPGVLQYNPPPDSASALQGGVEISLLRDALKDFRYSKMTIAISGQFGGEEEVKMMVTGANPSLYGGKSIELNLSFSGALDSIARWSVQSYKAPLDAVRNPARPLGGQK